MRHRVSKAVVLAARCAIGWNANRSSSIAVTAAGASAKSGSAFAVNALIEADQLQVLEGAPEEIHTPSLSGKGQAVMRCPYCKLALWSHYLGGGRLVAFVRVGTLDDPSLAAPEAHIFTASKQPWVVLPEGTPSFAKQYSAKELWPAESLQRMRAVRAAARPAAARYELVSRPACGPDGIGGVGGCKQLRTVDGVEIVAPIAKVTVDMHAALFGQGLIDFFAAQGDEHRGHAFARATAEK